MGTVPVAPKSIKLVSEGDRKVSGFKDKLACLGFNKMERMYMPTFIAMINLMNLVGSRNPRVQALFFQKEAGFAVPQKGHLASDELISFRQLGHRMDCR